MKLVAWFVREVLTRFRSTYSTRLSRWLDRRDLEAGR